MGACDAEIVEQPRAAVDVRAPPGLAGAYPILEPSPGTGVFWSYEGTLSYYPTLDAVEPSMEAELPNGMTERAHGVGFDGSTLILQDDDALYVDDGDWIPFATPSELSFHGQILSREGGFHWRPAGARTLYPYEDTNPLPAIEPFAGIAFNPLPGPQEHATPWRGGAAITSIVGQGAHGNALLLAVTDDAHVTWTQHDDAEVQPCANGSSVVASPDGDSLYVGYLLCSEAASTYVVRRFDCVSP